MTKVNFRIESQEPAATEWTNIYPGQEPLELDETRQTLRIMREAAKEQETGREFRVIGIYTDGDYTEELGIGL